MVRAISTVVSRPVSSLQPRPSAARGVATLALGYGLGSIPSADLARRWSGAGTDLRHVGSGNPGALNAGKNLGSRWGAFVFAVDVGKGIAASVIGRHLAGPSGANFAASAAVIGHCHPPGREGGKGVATSIGQVVATFPSYLPLDAAVAIGTAALPKWTQRTWAGTAAASVVWVGASVVAWRRGWSTGVDRPAPLALPVAAAISSAVIARRFVANPLVDGSPILKDSDETSGPAT